MGAAGLAELMVKVANMPNNNLSNSKPSLICYSGVGSVTGANFLLKAGGARILIDCGMIQGMKEAEAHNRDPFGYDPKSIDILIVTHAHLDHVGRIGKLVKEGFRGRIISTEPTRDLAELVMLDAAHLLAQAAQRNQERNQVGNQGRNHGDKNLPPICGEEDVKLAMTLWTTRPYHQSFELIPSVNVYFKDAGHILGSAIVEVTIDLAADLSGGNDKKIKMVFTGDLGNSPTPILRDTDNVTDADYLLVESVYGDRNHEPKDERRAKLKRVIVDTLARQGTLIIPAFSVERTQVILYEINDLVESGQISSVPVYLDSPLGSKVTEIYRSNRQLFNPVVQERIAKGDDIFDFPKLSYVGSDESSREIDHNHSAKIIIAGSGMSMGGRIRRHEAEYLPDPNNTILLVGFQPIGTLGRAIQDGMRSVHIDGADVPLKAHVESIFGYSAHKDSDHLVEFVEKTAEKVRKVFVAMGEPKASLFLAQRLRDELDVDAIFPEVGKEYFLE